MKRFTNITCNLAMAGACAATALEYGDIWIYAATGAMHLAQAMLDVRGTEE